MRGPHSKGVDLSQHLCCFNISVFAVYATLIYACDNMMTMTDVIAKVTEECVMSISSHPFTNLISSPCCLMRL